MATRSEYLKYYRNYFEHFYEPENILASEMNGKKFIVKVSMEMEIIAAPSKSHPDIDGLCLEKIVMDNKPYVNSTSRGNENYDIRSIPKTLTVESVREYKKTDVKSIFGK